MVSISNISALVYGLCWECQPLHTATAILTHEEIKVTSQLPDIKNLVECSLNYALKSHTLEELTHAYKYCPYFKMSGCVYFRKDTFLVLNCTLSESYKDHRLLYKFTRVLRESIELITLDLEDV
jgi:hypothetical protein